jgi:hypothetical protein
MSSFWKLTEYMHYINNAYSRKATDIGETSRLRGVLTGSATFLPNSIVPSADGWFADLTRMSVQNSYTQGGCRIKNC